MQAVSQKYKETMKQQFRNQQSFIRVTIGLINQEAQAAAFVPNQAQYTYYSSLKQFLDNYPVESLYAVCDQDYTRADGSLYFLPRNREDVVLNQGIVSKNLLGTIRVQFPIPYDIKGLTVEFGEAYPVEFKIVSDHNTVKISDNSNGHFVTEEIFEKVTYLEFVPIRMVNGESRLRIHQLTMGIGIYFDNRTILSATKKEHISPIMEELPTIDFDLTVDNKNRAYDIENEESAVNFLEVGQEISVIYGQELEDGTVEWLPGATVNLREWSADDEEMSFSATDRFEDLDGTYYKGKYRQEGISLYDLAVDVMEDAGIDPRTYWFDSYLNDVIVHNPMPVVPHREALQLIANAGRCILYQDRSGKIFMKSSFLPDMAASSDNQTYFSHADRILDESAKDEYGLASMDTTNVTPTQYFLPRKEPGAEYLNTGYISEEIADENGVFAKNPTVEIQLEAAYKCFGLLLEFDSNPPAEMAFRSYLNNELQESYTVAALSEVANITHEFPEFDRLVLEFTQGAPNRRIILHNVLFGDSTDYELAYGTELTKTPKGTQLPKVKELQVIRTIFQESEEEKELAKETVLVTAESNRYTVYFSNPCYGLSVSVAEGGRTAAIAESSSYFATVEISGGVGSCEVVVTGKEYVITTAKVGRQLHPTGTLETWENPLVSDISHAADLAEWIGDHMRSDREYDLQYRGEPRLDANDLVFLENKYVPDLMLRIYDHTLKFNGALSGTIKARRNMENAAIWRIMVPGERSEKSGGL